MRSNSSARFHASLMPLMPLLAIVLVLLIYAFARLHNVLSLPPFIDEMIHIERARSSILANAADGRSLSLFWLAAFLQGGAASPTTQLWVLRAGTILAGLAGAAAVYGAARLLSGGRIGRAAGMLAALCYTLTPYSLFYDRLVTLDSYPAAGGAVALYLLVRAMRTPGWPGGVLAIASGLAIVAAIGGKANGLMLAFLPALMLVGVRRATWRRQISLVALSYAALAVVGGGAYLFLRWRGVNYFGVATSVMGSSQTGGIFSRLVDNLGPLLRADVAYLSLPLLVGVGVLAVVLVVRRGRVAWLPVLAVIVPLAGLLAFSTLFRARYVVLHVPLLCVLIGVG